MILHRSYLTPSRLHRMFPDTPHHCPRCRGDAADFTHMIWSCPRLMPYWYNIRQHINTVTQMVVSDNILDCLLGLRKRTTTNKVQLKFQDLSLILAIRTITINWKSPRPPSLSTWHQAVLQWGKAESVALRREEIRHMRQHPISMEWDLMLQTLANVIVSPPSAVPSQH